MPRINLRYRAESVKGYDITHLSIIIFNSAGAEWYLMTLQHFQTHNIIIAEFRRYLRKLY
jgi:hypothetical protein